jgi:hypothetical protein
MCYMSLWVIVTVHMSWVFCQRISNMLEVHGPRQDENVWRKVHVSFIRQSKGDTSMIT